MATSDRYIEKVKMFSKEIIDNRCVVEVTTFIKQIINGDETWVQEYDV